MAQVAMTVARESASASNFDGPLPKNEDAQVSKLIDVSKCIGCKACQSACFEWNDKREEIGENIGLYENPNDLTPNAFTIMRFNEWDNPETGKLEWLIHKEGCMHCADPGCLKACPSPGAIVQYSNGIVDFQHDKCIGCGYCVKGCPFNVPRVSQKLGKAFKCTLCVDRVSEGMEPACAKSCPTHAIVFGTKSEMKAHAQTRIADLNSRGYAKAGLYDPQGVGGTHVMYVLNHADKPELYNGLPGNDVTISPMVNLWKGAAKYAGAALLGFTAVASAVHYAMVGGDRVTKAEEEAGRRIKEGKE